jgi:hypothetical protein
MFAAVEAARERSLGQRCGGGGRWREQKREKRSIQQREAVHERLFGGCRFGGVERGGA